ncbi:HAD family hydrolase [Flagellimonas okinawensis]|uniref:HAD family phosphatase n=1 Tax=Flagellimonas okinawensis TaxID=3031324 RepID=A0ABT5XQ28_9FLAO|nr:HAD family phosphatase [[Muricauda] okinawensis]MDF0708000.1 HAD family phosphatase [[Muricauda] okinawensis]
MAIKGVVFDFNGTLFFDTHLHNQAWDIFLNRHSFALTDEEKNFKIHGKNNAEIMSNLFSKDLSESDIQALSIEKEDIYQTLCLKEKMELAPGVLDFLDYLEKIQIPFTIATASDLYNLQFYFEHLKLEKYFDFDRIVYSNGKIKSKPHPEIFLKAMEVLKIDASETLIFEDSTSGILAAENSKAKKIIIVNSAENDYSKWNYDVITSFDEIDTSIFSK